MTRRRWWIVIGAVVFGVAAVVVVVQNQRRELAPASGGTKATSAQGMAGMNMSAGGAVSLTADQLRQFGVTFASVEVRTLTAETRATGVVGVDETSVSQVTAKFGGFVQRLHVDATGQAVRRGAALLDIYSPDLLAAQQELLLAGQLQRDIGRTTVPRVPNGTMDLVESAKRRLRLWDISEAQIDEIMHSGQPRRALTLYAPSSGVVVEKKVVEGQAIAAGQPLYTIADLSRVWIEIQLREVDAGAVRRGSAATIDLAAFPGRPVTGHVAFIYPTLDSVSRSVRARLAVPNVGGAIKPGMYATVRLATPGRSALTVPNTAVLRTGERNVVFVDMGRGELMPHDVELGRAAGDYVEVLSGLEPGQRVATSAQFLLDSESNLADVMRAMMGQMSSGDMRMKGDMNSKGADVRGMPGMTPPPSSTPKR